MLSLPDVMNGLFEWGGALACSENVRCLWRDKVVCGGSPWTTAFFMTWGFWNLYYYPHLRQWASFSGGVCLVTANTLWVVSCVYFRSKNKFVIRN